MPSPKGIVSFEKMNSLINAVLSQARNKLPHLDTIALLRAVDDFGDMSTRRRVHDLARKA